MTNCLGGKLFIGFTMRVSLNYCQFLRVLLERGVWDLIIYLSLIIAYRFNFVHVYANTPEPRTCTLLPPIPFHTKLSITPFINYLTTEKQTTQLSSANFQKC